MRGDQRQATKKQDTFKKKKNRGELIYMYIYIKKKKGPGGLIYIYTHIYVNEWEVVGVTDKGRVN